MDLIMQLLQLGFSFACCGVCMWYVYYMQKTQNEMNKQFIEELAAMRSAIDRVSDKLEVHYED